MYEEGVLRLKPKVSCVTFHEGCIHLLNRGKKEVRSTQEANLSFRRKISNVLRLSHHLLLFASQFFPYFFLPSPELRILGLLAEVTQPASGVKCLLTAAVTFAMVTVSTAGTRQVTAVLSMLWKPASRTFRPVHSVHDFRVSNCLSFSDKWSKSHSGSP